MYQLNCGEAQFVSELSRSARRSSVKMLLSQTILDHIIFQLTPTRTRFDLYVVSGSVTEKLTSGLLNPFLSHLQTAEEQFATGGYSIQIEPAPNYNKSSWFTKDTVERFVRFVSTPEVIERVNTIECELVQLEETIGKQNLDPTRDDPFMFDSSSSPLHGENSALATEKSPSSKMIRREYGSESTPAKNTKDQLLRALNARRSALQKEQGMAFARATAAGFELSHLMQLIMFSECFRAIRMKEACIKFVTLCQKQHIPGFCSDDMLSIDKDLVMAVAKTGCTAILNCESEVETHTTGNELSSKSQCHTQLKPVFLSVSHDEWKLDDGFGSSDHPFSVERQYQQKVPVYINSNPATQVCQWSTAREWPNIYTITSNTSPSQVHQHGFSPGSQESFNILSDMSPPPDVAAKFHFMDTHNQLSPDIQTYQNAYEIKYFSPGGRESIGSTNIHHEGRMNCKNTNGNRRRQRKIVTDEESVGDDYDNETSDVMDSLITPNPLSMTPQARFNSPGVVIDGLRRKWADSADLNIRTNWKNYKNKEEENYKFSGEEGDHSELSQSEQETLRSFGSTRHVLQIKEVDESITLLRNGRSVHSENTVSFTPMLDAELQKSKRSSTIDNSFLLFGQHNDYSPGIRSKKRLEFQEPEAIPGKMKIEKDLMPLDGMSFVRVQPIDQEQDQRKSMFIESEMQGSKIYDMMSRKALMVNSMADKQEHDGLLMMPRRQKNSSSTDHVNDVMKIDVDLIKPTYQTQSSKHLNGHCEPSQERVKKFLDQYNEKREAKLRAHSGSSKRVERDGKMKAMEEVLQKRKSDISRVRRAERPTHVMEAQLRADEIRAYKAALKKSKEEKDHEEKKRLDVLKAQRQERIAARKNVNSFITRGKSTSSPPPTSKLSSFMKSSSLVLKARSSSLLGSDSMPPVQQRFAPKPKELEFNEVTSKISSRFTRNHVRNSSPSIMDHRYHPQRQTEFFTSLKPGNASRPSLDTVKLEVPPKLHLAKDITTMVSDVSDGQITSGSATKQSVSTSNGFKSQSSLVLQKVSVSSVDDIGAKLRVKTSLLDTNVKVTSLEKEMQEVSWKPPNSNGISFVEGKDFLKKGDGARSGAKVVKVTSPRKSTVVDKLPIPTIEDSSNINVLRIKIKPDASVQTESFGNRRISETYVGLKGFRSSASLSEITHVDSSEKTQSNGIIIRKELVKNDINSIEASEEGRRNNSSPSPFASPSLSPSRETYTTLHQLVLDSHKSVDGEVKSSEPNIDNETSQDRNRHKSVEQINSIPWVSEPSRPLKSSRSHGGEMDYPIKNAFQPIFSFSNTILMSNSRIGEEDPDACSVIHSVVKDPDGSKQKIDSFRKASADQTMTNLTLVDQVCTQNAEAHSVVKDPEWPKQKIDSFRMASADQAMTNLTLVDQVCTQNAEAYKESLITLPTTNSPIGSLNGDHTKHKSSSERSSLFSAAQISTPTKDHYYKGFKSLLSFRRRSPQSGALTTPTRSEDMERDRVDGRSSKHMSLSDDKKWHSDSSLMRNGVKDSAKHPESGPSDLQKSSGSSGKARRTFSFFRNLLGKGK